MSNIFITCEIYMNSIKKFEEFDNTNYCDFIATLKRASFYGYVPGGIDELVNTHGTAIYKAYLSHLHLKSEGIASFFTSQKIGAILYQIVMKKIYETQSSTEKHTKIVRDALSNITDIRDMCYGGEKNEWLAVSSNIFDFTHGESWAFYLAGGESLLGPTDFFSILEKGIQLEPYNLNQQTASDLVRDIQYSWSSFKKRFPPSILELVIIDDKPNFKKTICFTEEFASKPQFPKTYNQLLMASDQMIQARVSTPNPSDPNKIKILRFTPDSSYEHMKCFKEIVSDVVEKYIPKSKQFVASKDSEVFEEQQNKLKKEKYCGFFNAPKDQQNSSSNALESKSKACFP